MGNKGAFITMDQDLKPNFTTYDAVVSAFFNKKASTVKMQIFFNERKY